MAPELYKQALKKGTDINVTYSDDMKDMGMS